MTSEYTEYVRSIVANTLEMVAAVDTVKNELLEMLENEYHGSIIQIAKETQEALIQDTYRIGIAPFMQPAVEEVEEPEDEISGGGDTGDAGEDRRGRR